LEYSIWTVAVTVLAMVAFLLREAWPPLAYPARLLGAIYAVMFGLIAQGGALAGPIGGVMSFAVCTWAWLACPLLLAIWVVQWIRVGSQRSPQRTEGEVELVPGMTFWQAFPAYLIALAISTAWIAVIMAHSGFMRYAFDAKEGMAFALFALPLAALPLVLMILRRAVPMAWRRLRGSHA
jgi:hypothetical protein